MKDSIQDLLTIIKTPSLLASCLGILLILAIKLSIIGGVVALIYLAIKWLIQNT